MLPSTPQPVIVRDRLVNKRMQSGRMKIDQQLYYTPTNFLSVLSSDCCLKCIRSEVASTFTASDGSILPKFVHDYFKSTRYLLNGTNNRTTLQALHQSTPCTVVKTTFELFGFGIKYATSQLILCSGNMLLLVCEWGRIRETVLQYFNIMQCTLIRNFDPKFIIFSSMVLPLSFSLAS